MDVMPGPGDWFVVNTGSLVSATIQIASYISDRVSGAYRNPEISQWDHAGMCVAVGKPPLPGMMKTAIFTESTIWIAEAEPGGARLVPWHYQDRPHQWSTGLITMHPESAAAALRYTQPGPWGNHGVPYADWDYVALTAHALRIPAPGLKEFIGSSHSMICSQLVDQSAADGGDHLFDDKRWPGYVKPSDLGWLLVQARASAS